MESWMLMSLNKHLLLLVFFQRRLNSKLLSSIMTLMEMAIFITKNFWKAFEMNWLREEQQLLRKHSTPLMWIEMVRSLIKMSRTCMMFLVIETLYWAQRQKNRSLKTFSLLLKDFEGIKTGWSRRLNGLTTIQIFPFSYPAMITLS